MGLRVNKNKVSKNFGGSTPVTDFLFFFLGGGGLPPKTGLQETLVILEIGCILYICIYLPIINLLLLYLLTVSKIGVNLCFLCPFLCESTRTVSIITCLKSFIEEILRMNISCFYRANMALEVLDQAVFDSLPFHHRQKLCRKLRQDQIRRYNEWNSKDSQYKKNEKSNKSGRAHLKVGFQKKDELLDATRHFDDLQGEHFTTASTYLHLVLICPLANFTW